MRRAKLGDVYVIQVSNGYKLFQWAYQIPQWGKYIRVFDGIYNSIPENVAEIVFGEHSYIIGFDASKAYQIGLAQLVDNIPVPDEFPFPIYRLDFWRHELDDDITIWVRPSPTHPSEHVNEIYRFEIKTMQDLPQKYRNAKLIDGQMSAGWLMYLFDYNFTLNDLKRFWPQLILGDEMDEILNGYQNRINYLVEEDKAKRNPNKRQPKES